MIPSGKVGEEGDKGEMGECDTGAEVEDCWWSAVAAMGRMACRGGSKKAYKSQIMHLSVYVSGVQFSCSSFLFLLFLFFSSYQSSEMKHANVQEK